MFKCCENKVQTRPGESLHQLQWWITVQVNKIASILLHVAEICIRADKQTCYFYSEGGMYFTGIKFRSKEFILDNLICTCTDAYVQFGEIKRCAHIHKCTLTRT